MHLEKQFEVKRPRDVVIEIVARDETLLGLFPEGRTEIVSRDESRYEIRTHYNALGREGTAIFHFVFGLDGDVRFDKVCDGRVWRKLQGNVRFEAVDAGTRVLFEMDGKTKTLVPELAIRGPMQEQLEQMAAALRARIESI